MPSRAIKDVRPNQIKQAPVHKGEPGSPADQASGAGFKSGKSSKKGYGSSVPAPTKKVSGKKMK